MMKKILWLLAIVSLTAYLFFWHSYVKPFNFSDFFESVDFISTLLTVLIMSLILAVLLAVIPYKSVSYNQKLLHTYPLAIILMCVLIGLTFYSKGPHYYAIRTDAGSDCKTVKNGNFQLDDVLIERNELTQVETNVKTQEKIEFSVTWLNDCEYVLNSNKHSIKVKIVAVNKTYYECYAYERGRTSKRMRLIRK